MLRSLVVVSATVFAVGLAGCAQQQSNQTLNAEIRAAQKRDAEAERQHEAEIARIKRDGEIRRGKIREAGEYTRKKMVEFLKSDNVYERRAASILALTAQMSIDLSVFPKGDKSRIKKLEAKYYDLIESRIQFHLDQYSKTRASDSKQYVKNMRMGQYSKFIKAALMTTGFGDTRKPWEPNQATVNALIDKNLKQFGLTEAFR